MGKLDGQVALVTGAGQGIGRAIAEVLAREGADIVVCGRTLAPLEACVAAVVALGRRAVAVPTDVGSRDSVDASVAKAMETFGRIDVLVNNAGVTRDKLLIRMSDEDWDEVMQTNLKGAFMLSRAVARPMMKQRSGSIIQISSIIGLIGNAGQCRNRRQYWTGQLCSFKSRTYRYDQVIGKGIGFPWYPCKCGCSGVYSVKDDRSASTRGAGTDAGQHATGTFRRAGGCGKCGSVFSV